MPRRNSGDGVSNLGRSAGINFLCGDDPVERSSRNDSRGEQFLHAFSQWFHVSYIAGPQRILDRKGCVPSSAASSVLATPLRVWASLSASSLFPSMIS